jgi:hypothetical protein
MPAKDDTGIRLCILAQAFNDITCDLPGIKPSSVWDNTTNGIAIIRTRLAVI